MSIRLRLVVIIVLVALVPLAVTAWTTLGEVRGAIDSRVHALQERAGEQAAAAVTQRLADSVAAVERMARGVPWSELSPAERAAAAWLVYRQADDVAAVVLLDGAARPLATAALTPEQAAGDLAAHPRWPVEAGAALQEAVAGAPVGAAFLLPGGAAPLVPLAITVDGGGEVRTVAVALALTGVCEAMRGIQTPTLRATIVDERERVLCGDGAPLGAATLAADRRRTRTAATRGWSVLVDQDVDTLRAPGEAVRRHTLRWLAIGSIAAVAAGLLLARRIARPVEALARGAAELGGGNVAYRIPVGRGRDELARLSAAFNRMGDELQRRDAEQQAWNGRLQELVTERGRELAEVQEQLARSQRIAAVGSLGAGFAHEINNPLTGLLGMTQLLLARSREQACRAGDVALLESMEREATRIGELVRALCRLTDEAGTQAGHVTIDVDRLVDDTVALVERRVSERAVTLVRAPSPGLPPVLGDAGELQQVLLHLIDNALQAMPSAGRLAIATEAVAGHLVRVAVTDTGAGIPSAHLSRIFDPFFTTKQSWRAPGLGLTTAFRIVERHRGTIRVHSVVDEGTTMTVTLPAARPASHLD